MSRWTDTPQHPASTVSKSNSNVWSFWIPNAQTESLIELQPRLPQSPALLPSHSFGNIKYVLNLDEHEYKNVMAEREQRKIDTDPTAISEYAATLKYWCAMRMYGFNSIQLDCFSNFADFIHFNRTLTCTHQCVSVCYGGDLLCLPRQTFAWIGLNFSIYSRCAIVQPHTIAKWQRFCCCEHIA